MSKRIIKVSVIIIAIGLFSCKKKINQTQKEISKPIEKKETLPFHKAYMEEIKKIPVGIDSLNHENMILIKGGTFLMGATSDQGREDERPVHKEKVSNFYMDITEVTNKQFNEFVLATGYITTAERPVDANHIASVEGVDPSTIDTSPASLIFTGNPQMWWAVQKGASWKHPKGPESNIEGKDDHPVVQVSWYDAMAYCKWAGKRLPTEEEFEYAARSGGKRIKYNWGDDLKKAQEYVNFHQGTFPNKNLVEDNFEGSSPVKSFKENSLGLYDIGGNVWEWTLNSYFKDAYQKKVNLEKPIYEEDSSIYQRKVIRGGSFLCNESYCSGYRVSARMSSTPDTGLEHTGFRCVKDVK